MDYKYKLYRELYNMLSAYNGYMIIGAIFLLAICLIVSGSMGKTPFEKEGKNTTSTRVSSIVCGVLIILIIIYLLVKWLGYSQYNIM